MNLSSLKVSFGNLKLSQRKYRNNKLNNKNQ